MEGKNVGTIRGKSPKQDQTSAKGLTIELSEDEGAPTIDGASLVCDLNC